MRINESLRTIERVFEGYTYKYRKGDKKIYGDKLKIIPCLLHYSNRKKNFHVEAYDVKLRALEEGC
jgi:hypothetical protein